MGKDSKRKRELAALSVANNCLPSIATRALPELPLPSYRPEYGNAYLLTNQARTRKVDRVHGRIVNQLAKKSEHVGLRHITLG